MTLFLEWEVLSLVPGVRRYEYLGIDPQFWRMHVAIDNATEGHGAKARRAVEIYLDRVLKEGGPQAQEEHWQRIWRGFVAFAVPGFDLFQNRNQMTVEAEKARLRRQTPHDRVVEIIKHKRHFGNRNHLRKQLGPHRINDLFDNAALFLEQLANSPWVVPGDADNSRFLTQLTTFKGPMYKVFSKDDLGAWRDWIVWLGREGDTGRPKRHIGRAEAMKILLGELRALMIASHGHRVYRAPAPHKSLAKLFELSDLDEIMRTLRDEKNGWIIPFRPADSVMVVDLLRPSRPMGAALDRRFPQLFDEIGRMVVYEWIAAGCPVPGEASAPDAKYAVPRRRERRLFMQQYGMGAVH